MGAHACHEKARERAGQPECQRPPSSTTSVAMSAVGPATAGPPGRPASPSSSSGFVSNNPGGAGTYGVPAHSKHNPSGWGVGFRPMSLRKCHFQAPVPSLALPTHPPPKPDPQGGRKAPSPCIAIAPIPPGGIQPSLNRSPALHHVRGGRVGLRLRRGGPHGAGGEQLRGGGLRVGEVRHRQRVGHRPGGGWGWRRQGPVWGRSGDVWWEAAGQNVGRRGGKAGQPLGTSGGGSRGGVGVGDERRRSQPVPDHPPPRSRVSTCGGVETRPTLAIGVEGRV